MRSRLVLAFLVGALVFLISIVGYGSYWISQQQQREDATRREIVNEINLQNCLDIEALKRAEREDALESFSRLDETLQLLKLERTPEIEARARENLRDDLRRFREEPCPRAELN